MEPYRSTKRRCSREGRAYLQIRYQLSSKISFITKEMAPKQLICNPDTSKHGQIDPKNQTTRLSHLLFLVILQLEYSQVKRIVRITCLPLKKYRTTHNYNYSYTKINFPG
nr:hypothetical protein [Zea mays]